MFGPIGAIFHHSVAHPFALLKFLDVFLFVVTHTKIGDTLEKF